jgi:hypothetical protein
MATIDESALAGKIRDRPINDRLRSVLLDAAREAGVDVVHVVSGGQPGSSGQSVGSNRHDGGAAADLELIARGRALDFTNAGDLDAIRRFVAACAAARSASARASTTWGRDGCMSASATARATRREWSGARAAWRRTRPTGWPAPR